LIFFGRGIISGASDHGNIISLFDAGFRLFAAENDLQ
jgi:hypothetical protein